MGQAPAFASAPELRDCEGTVLPPYTGADKIRVIVRVKVKMPRSFTPLALCVRIDDKLVRPEPPTAPFEQLRTGIGFVGDVPPGDHGVHVEATIAGVGQMEGHRFDVATDHAVPPGGQPLLDVALTATGGPDLEPSKRVVFQWDEHAYKGPAPP